MIPTRTSWNRACLSPLLLISLFYIPAALEASAQETSLNRRSLPAVLAPTAPAIDGDLADPVWSQAPKAERFSDQISGSTDVDPTEAWLLYDEQHLYVAFHARDAEPDRIVAREIRRDADFQGEDTVTFSIDPYHVHRFDDTSSFTVNALGTLSSRIAGGRAGKTEWKGEWSAAAKRAEDGWTVEMRIPWSILNYPAEKSPVTVGINFSRRQERTKLQTFWSNVGQRYDNQLAGHWEGVRFPQRRFRPQLSLLPYMASGYRDARGLSAHSGVDARLGLTPELTGVAALNPDFENVEAAIEGIEFSRSERFVPDVRPFFLEGGDIFSAGSSRGIGQLFFSRRVPAFDLGTKVYGKAGGENTVGLLSTFDFGHRSDLVGRYRRRFSDDLSLGATLVRRQLPGDTNTVVGIDPSYRFGLWQFRTEYAATSGDEAGGDAGSSILSYAGERASASARYTWIAPDFRAANGFVPFTDFRGWNFFARYGNEYRTGPIREWDIDLDVFHDERYNGRPFRRTREIELEMETRNDWAFRLGWSGGRFEEERDSEYSVGFTKNVSNRTRRWGLTYSFGTRADEPISFLRPRVNVRLFKKYDVGWSASILRHTRDREQHVITINREISAQRALGARLTMSNGRSTFFLSYRRSGSSGMETFVIIGDPDPNDEGFDKRIVTKVVWPM